MINILGLAGTKSLIQTIQICLKDNPNEKNYLICRHCFSINVEKKKNWLEYLLSSCLYSREKPSTKLNISHNQGIENETNSEIEYYQLLDKMRNQGITVTSVTQGSSYGDTLISRYSGVKIHQYSDSFESNIYDKNSSLIMENINKMLLQSFNQRFINQEFIIDCFKYTHWREQYYGCFLHDVKVYFTMCVIDKLFRDDIIEERLLYIKDNIVYDHPIKNYQHSMIETVIKPTRIEDYSVYFNNWLSTDTVDNFVEVDYLVTDPGPGYKDNGEQYFVSQDVDDVITLSLIPKIHNICISDETVLLSRTCFVYHYFKGKICNLEIFLNDSVKKVKEQYPEYYNLVCQEDNFKVAKQCINFIKEQEKLIMDIEDIDIININI